VIAIPESPWSARHYKKAPLRDRVHVAARLALCPFRRLAAQVPSRGLIVDLGCGHGHLAHALAMESPRRRVVGIDLSPHKLSIASAVGTSQRVQFLQGSALANPIVGPCQAILLVDVLYLLRAAQQEQVLRDCYDRLAPGGTLLIKTTDDRPAWKAGVSRFEEWLAVRVLRITHCETDFFAFRPLTEWAALCERIGFETEIVRLDQGYVHPHGAVVGVRR
jgi:2-polyprenyl-6-hydroxyphenyl methylase/3-demethylubiquinone-9 3-methyltransferase